jgi:plasmid maintenance system killer protein
MEAEYSNAVSEALEDAPAAVRKAFYKQVGLLVQDLRHPSLHAKKYDESNERWQARVNKNWRFYFKIIDDTYRILKLIPHPKK